MRLHLPAIAALAAVVVAAAVAAAAPPPIPLRAAFEAAPALHGYDRYLELETGRYYTGGLLFGPTWDEDRTRFQEAELGCDVMIAGNGAILDLEGEQICISFCNNRLDIQDCIILNGGVRFVGDNSVDVRRVPEGSVRYCTFYRPAEYAVRLQGAGAGVLCERNLVVDAVDTGQDVLIWTGITGNNLPTGLSFGLSVQTGAFGLPGVHDNWTYHTDPRTNEDPLRHFGFL